MVAEVEWYWTKLFIGDGFTFQCNGWRSLFSIHELVYQELYVEFFATVSFDGRTTDTTYNWTIAFRLGGVYKECNLCEFAWRMGLYNEAETQLPHFILFLQCCV